MTAVVVVARGAPATDWFPAHLRARSRRRGAIMVVSHTAAVEQSPSPRTAVSGCCLQVQGQHNTMTAYLGLLVDSISITHCLAR